MGKKLSAKPFGMEQLEPRLMFAADLEPITLDGGRPHLNGLTELPVIETDLVPGTLKSQSGAVVHNPRHEVLFIDTRVPDYQNLVTDLLAKHDDGRQIDVVILDSSRDGIEQINEVLSKYQNINAVHLVSHGTDGAVQLGSAWLNNETLNSYADSIEGWNYGLNSEADLLFYGCDLAAGEEGLALIDSLSLLTGADVAASDDLTGHADLGGDWDLEHMAGNIETNIAFSTAAQQNWRQVLAVTVDASSSGSTADQASVTVSHTTSGSNRLMLVGVSMQPEADSVSSVTYNGVNLTPVGTEENSGGKARVEIWKLLAPDTGTHDVIVNLTGTSHKGVTVGVMTYTGVNQTTPTLAFSGDSGDSTTASTTVTAATDDLVFGVVQSHRGSSAAEGAGQTEYWDISVNNANGSGTTEAGATSVTTSWIVNNDKWSAASVVVQADTNLAETASLIPTQDAYIQLKKPTTNDGTADSMVIDRESTDLQRALLQFDLSSIPVGSTITGATLKIEATDSEGLLTVDVYQLLESWTEGSTTWNERSSGTNWSTAGGAFNTTALDSITTGETGQHSWDITALVQDWIDGTKQNYGVLVGSPDGGGNRTITYDSREGATPPVLEICYTVANTAPTIGGTVASQAVNDNATISPFSGVIIGDVDNPAQTLSVSVTLDVAAKGAFTTLNGFTDAGGGVYTFSGTAAAATAALQGMVFNPADNRVQPTLTETTTFTISVDDGIAGPITDNTTTVISTSSNDAPVLAPSATPVLNSAAEDAGAPSGAVGTLVSDLVDFPGGGGNDNVTDLDNGAVTGIAVTQSDTTNGTWYYSIDGGSSWNPLGIVTVSSARLLAADANARIYFQPDPNYNGTVNNAITFRAWDQTSGINGGFADTTTGGGITAFSTGQDFADITVTEQNDTPVGLPTISGAVTEDQVLTADTSGISDADGLGVFSYQWLRNGVAIGGATASTYTLGDADVGTQISVEVSYTDGNSTAEGPLASAQTAAVTNINDAPVGLPIIIGTVTEGQVLTADTSGISDADGLGAFSYQWLRNGVAIGGATANTYTLGALDVGTLISVEVSYTDGNSSAEGPLTSAQTAAVTNINNAPVALPTITGIVTEDQVLTADTSGISDTDGLGPFSYQWLRDGLIISGSTADSYTLGDADVGAQISVRVSYVDGNSTSESITSGQTAAVTNINDAPVGLPIITGLVTEDQILTANTAGISDADGLGAFSYQWLRNGVAIGGATASTYTLGDADVGTQISVEVSYTDGNSSAEGPLTSVQTAAVTNINDAPTGSVTISGTPTEDQTLTASNTLADVDGLGAISYQWQRDGIDIGGATGSTYTLVQADVGTTITVVASYTDGGGKNESVNSAGVGPIANVNDAPAGLLTITGTVQEDQILTADTSGISDEDGLGVFSYQWLRNGVAIGGATASTYNLGDADVGTQISVEVSYTDGQGTVETITSVQTAAVTNINDAPVGLPIITGIATEDQILTANTAGISDADGLGLFSYQWLRNGVAIGGATASTYTLGDADVGTQISVEVSYTDGNSTAQGPLTSAQTAAVTNINDVPTATNLSAGETYTEDIPLNLTDIVVSDVDSANVTVTLTLSDVTAGSLSTATSGAVNSTFANGIWTAGGAIADVNTLLAGVTFNPALNYNSDITIATSVSDGVAPAVTGVKNMTGTAVGDTPQVGNITTFEDTQSGLIIIDRNVNDGAEVMYFRISNITNGTLYRSDGVTQINNGDYITFAEAQVGVRFTPATNSTANGSFSVESSEDGSTVAAQSGTVTSTITVLFPADVPTDDTPPDDDVGDNEDVPDDTKEDVAEENELPGNVEDKKIVQKINVHSGKENDSQDPGKKHTPETVMSPVNTTGKSHLVENTMIAEQPVLDEESQIHRQKQNVRQGLVFSKVLNRLETLGEAIKKDTDKEIQLDKNVIASGVAVSTGLSVGYVVWLLKGGSLLSSVLSSLPAWHIADPMPILTQKKEYEDDEESLETIIKNESQDEDKKEKKSDSYDGESPDANIKKESKDEEII